MPASYPSVTMTHPEWGKASLHFKKTISYQWSKKTHEAPTVIPFTEWDSHEETLRKSRVSITRWSWVTETIIITRDPDTKGMYVAIATAAFYKESLTIEGQGSTPKEAYQDFWRLWNLTCREMRKPHDLVLLRGKPTRVLTGGECS